MLLNLLKLLLPQQVQILLSRPIFFKENRGIASSYPPKKVGQKWAKIVAVFLVILVTGCGSDPKSSCGYCWLYAGKALEAGNIQQGFEQADEILDYADESLPKKGLIRDAMSLYAIMTTFIFIDPDLETFDVCANNICVVYFQSSPDTYHYAIYDYNTHMLYDNCHCLNGCDTFDDHKYLRLYMRHI